MFVCTDPRLACFKVCRKSEVVWGKGGIMCRDGNKCNFWHLVKVLGLMKFVYL